MTRIITSSIYNTARALVLHGLGCVMFAFANNPVVFMMVSGASTTAARTTL